MRRHLIILIPIIFSSHSRALSRDLVAELPFILMHPKPEDDEPPLPQVSNPRLSLKPSDAAGDGQSNGGVGASNEDPNCNATGGVC